MCRCNFRSPFLWATYPQSSMFASDPKFAKGAGTGLTMNAIQSQAMTRFEEREGRSAGTIYGISDKADKQADSRTPRKKRSASHYGSTR